MKLIRHLLKRLVHFLLILSTYNDKLLKFKFFRKVFLFYLLKLCDFTSKNTGLEEIIRYFLFQEIL